VRKFRIVSDGHRHIPARSAVQHCAGQCVSSGCGHTYSLFSGNRSWRLVWGGGGGSTAGIADGKTAVSGLPAVRSHPALWRQILPGFVRDSNSRRRKRSRS
jgi:hypothetical protein